MLLLADAASAQMTTAPSFPQPAGSAQETRDGQAPTTVNPQDPLLLVVETKTRGVDPVVGRFFNQHAIASAQGFGYRIGSPQAVRDVMAASGYSYPPTPAQLWALMRQMGAARALLITVWAAGDRYAFQIQVGSADGSGPYFHEGQGDQASVLEELDRALSEALPAPGLRLPDRDAEAELARDARDGAQYFDTAGAPPPPTPRHRPWRVVLHGDTAFGFSSDGFRNHMLGARMDYRFDHEMALGVYVGYANLQGRDERAESLLGYLQFEDRVPVNRRGTFQVPLRIGLGYLAKNGPLMRLSAGIGFNLGKRADIAVDILTPTFWLTGDDLLFSLDLGLEVGFKL